MKRLFMRRVAASIVYINEKEFHNHVVELLNHQVTNHYPLEGEQPMTEWLGGTIIVHEQEAFHIRKVLSSAELSTDDGCGYGYIERL